MADRPVLTLTRRRLTALVAALAVGSATGGWLWFQHEARAIRLDKYSDLETIGRLKTEAIERWRADRLGDATDLMGSSFLTEAIANWLNDQDAAGKERLLTRLRRLKDRFGYEEVQVLDPTLKVRLSLNGSLTVDPEALEALAAALSDHRPALTDLHVGATGSAPHLGVIAPLFVPDGGAEKLVAAIVLVSDARQFLYPFIQSWPVPSESAETLIVERRGNEVVFLNDLRFRNGAALSLRIPVSRLDVPSVQAVLGRVGPVEGLDYRGAQVVADLRPVAGSPWFVVAKVDRDEIFAPLRVQAAVTLAAVLGLIVLAGLGTGFAYKAQGKAAFAELYRVEHERRDALEELKTTLHSIGDAVIATDAGGRVQLMNPIAELLTGWSEAEASGRPLAEVFHIVDEQTWQPVEDPVARVLREGAIVGLANHTLLISRDAVERPIADSGAPVRDEHGAITGVVLVFRDQSAERAAQRESLLLTSTIRASRDEIYIFDGDTLRFRFVNDGALHNLGYTLEAIRKLTPIDLKPEFTAESFAELVRPLRTGERAQQVFETVHQRADGSRYPVEVHLQLVEHLGERVFLAVIQDITERKHSEEELWATQHTLQAISDGAPVMICVVDSQRRIVTANRAFQEASGWPRQEPDSYRACGALGCINALDDPEGCGFGPHCSDCRLRQVIDDTLLTSTAHRDIECNTTLVRQGRREEIVLLVSTNSFELAGERRVVVCLIDITERRRLELQLRQGQKMEAVGTLAGGIAHDFNNLLQALLSSTQAARLQARGTQLEKTLAEVQVQVQRGAALTRQLLLFSRQAPVHRERLDLGALVAEQAAMLRRVLPETIALTVSPAAAPMPVEADAGQLGQVLTNLVVNARDAMPDGGRLAVSVAGDDGLVALEVSDSGVGMEGEVLERIFDPFFTTKGPGQGTGLGLAVVWGIVKDHGGRVAVESQPGLGSTFRILLPAAPTTAQAPAVPESDEPLPGGTNERVMLIEDEDGARQGLAELLGALGYDVTAAASGEEALQRANDPPFDVLLTDYRLPGVTGLEVAAELVRRWDGLKVVVMSGYAPDDVARDLFSGGAVHFLQKPFDMATLAHALHEALAGSPRADA